MNVSSLSVQIDTWLVFQEIVFTVELRLTVPLCFWIWEHKKSVSWEYPPIGRKPWASPADHSSLNAMALALETSAASYPSTKRFTALVSDSYEGPSKCWFRNSSMVTSSSNCWSRSINRSQSSWKLSPSDRRFCSTFHDFPSPARHVTLASFINALDSGRSPWINSAPPSAGKEKPSSLRVCIRPPTRSRASSTCTDFPERDSSLAAYNPAAPAPIIITSTIQPYTLTI